MAIRNGGYAKSSGDFTRSMTGASAPVFNAGDEVIDSVGVAWDKSEMGQVDFDRIALSVKRAGREISARMRDRSMGKVLRPRAVGEQYHPKNKGVRVSDPFIFAPHVFFSQISP